MADSGGGVIVYGVSENKKRAINRVHVGEVTETYERAFGRVAVSGIQPPALNLDFNAS